MFWRLFRYYFDIGVPTTQRKFRVINGKDANPVTKSSSRNLKRLISSSHIDVTQIIITLLIEQPDTNGIPKAPKTDFTIKFLHPRFLVTNRHFRPSDVSIPHLNRAFLSLWSIFSLIVRLPLSKLVPLVLLYNSKRTANGEYSAYGKSGARQSLRSVKMVLYL